MLGSLFNAGISEMARLLVKGPVWKPGCVPTVSSRAREGWGLALHCPLGSWGCAGSRGVSQGRSDGRVRQTRVQIDSSFRTRVHAAAARTRASTNQGHSGTAMLKANFVAQDCADGHGVS